VLFGVLPGNILQQHTLFITFKNNVCLLRWPLHKISYLTYAFVLFGVLPASSILLFVLNSKRIFALSDDSVQHKISYCHSHNNWGPRNNFQRFLVLVFYWKTVEKPETDPQLLWEWQYLTLFWAQRCMYLMHRLWQLQRHDCNTAYHTWLFVVL
jgi:hypothetical protein